MLRTFVPLNTKVQQLGWLCKSLSLKTYFMLEVIV